MTEYTTERFNSLLSNFDNKNTKENSNLLTAFNQNNQTFNEKHDSYRRKVNHSHRVESFNHYINKVTQY